MPTVKPLSREIRICLAIWRKAYREREGSSLVILNAPNFSQAIAIRQSMYRALKPFRDGSKFDEELRLAGELFVCAVEKQASLDVPHRLIMKPRITLDTLDTALSALGISERDLLLDEERLETSKLTEFLEGHEPEGPTPEPLSSKRSSTPFYTRED